MRGVILPAALLAGACAVSVLAVPGVLAAQRAGAADITVEYQYPQLTVRVTHPTNLRAVLEELCQATDTDCELAPALSAVPFEPVIVQGGWLEVVRKLFEGTQFDFGAIAPSPQQAGRLFIKSRMPGAKQTNGAARSELRGDGSSVSSSVGAAPSGGDLSGTNPGPPTQQQATPEDATGVSQGQSESASDSSQGRVGPSGSAGVASSLTGQTTQPAQAGAPSEDQTRSSLEAARDLYVGPPASNLASPPPGMAVLPFPDENGNPVLVRITNQPITVLPFPDSLGQPISVAPGVPGLMLQSPFPSTPIGPK
jgi:hypothetical protein